jgi:hypothetical protein
MPPLISKHKITPSALLHHAKFQAQNEVFRRHAQTPLAFDPPKKTQKHVDVAISTEVRTDRSWNLGEHKNGKHVRLIWFVLFSDPLQAEISYEEIV